MLTRNLITLNARGVLALLAIALSIGCSDLSTESERFPVGPPSDPNRPSPPPPATSGSPPPFPTVSSTAAIYDGPKGLYDELAAYHGSLLPTRYVLFSDSTFQLQFASFRFGIFSYAGRYSRSDSLITYIWEGWSTAGPWGATGTLRGDTLAVRYNMIMMMTDFIDGDYVRSR